MPGDLAIWDLAIAANNQRLLAGDETALGRRETTLIFLGKEEFFLLYRFLGRRSGQRRPSYLGVLQIARAWLRLP
jgi:hypothetical protein